MHTVRLKMKSRERLELAFIVGLICIIFPLLMTPFIVNFVITNQVHKQLREHATHCEQKWHIEKLMIMIIIIIAYVLNRGIRFATEP